MRRLTILIVLLTLLIVNPVRGNYQKVIKDEKGDVETFGDINGNNADIESVTYSQYDDGRVIIAIKVYGKIDKNGLYGVDIFTIENETNETYYSISYTENPYLPENESGLKIYLEREDSSKNISGNFEITSDGNVLRIHFYLDKSNEKFQGLSAGVMLIYPLSVLLVLLDENATENTTEIPSSAYDELEYFEEQNQSTEQEQNQQNNQEQQNNQGEKRSPGFEFIILISAILAVLLLSIRKKKL